MTVVNADLAGRGAEGLAFGGSAFPPNFRSEHGLSRLVHGLSRVEAGWLRAIR